MDIRVAGNPAKVSHATESIIGVNIEDIFDSNCSTEEISSDGMHDTLGLAGRSGSLCERLSTV